MSAMPVSKDMSDVIILLLTTPMSSSFPSKTLTSESLYMSYKLYMKLLVKYVS